MNYDDDDDDDDGDGHDADIIQRSFLRIGGGKGDGGKRSCPLPFSNPEKVRNPIGKKPGKTREKRSEKKDLRQEVRLFETCPPPPSLPKINLNANKKAPGGRWETEEEEVIK
jgi:hypothetical protein